MILFVICVAKHSEQKSILLITSSTNTQKRNLCSVTTYLMTLNAAIIPHQYIPVTRVSDMCGGRGDLIQTPVTLPPFLAVVTAMV